MEHLLGVAILCIAQQCRTSDQNRDREEQEDIEMAKEIKKIVLAYSGGLDTSIIIPWLKENYEAGSNWRVETKIISSLPTVKPNFLLRTVTEDNVISRIESSLRNS